MEELTEKAEILSKKLIITITQDSDCVESGDLGQFLSIESEEDGGGGAFFIMKTERWSFNDFEELIETLNLYKNNYDKL